MPDFRTYLELKIGKTGWVNTEYGGFEIVVKEAAHFPWHDVFAALLKHGYEVWVCMKDDEMVVMAQAASD